jgi:predicted nucleic acid-binding protein
MMFVDTNVLMYAVGRPHPLRSEARAFFEASLAEERPLATSAEVLQELMHAYIPVNRLETLGAAMKLAVSTIQTVWPVEPDDVQFAHQLLESYRGLGARDLLHLASCRRRGVRSIKTFDRALGAAFDS